MVLPVINATNDSSTDSSVRYASDHDFKVFSRKIFLILDAILNQKYKQFEIYARIERAAAEDALERVDRETPPVIIDDDTDANNSILSILKNIIEKIVSKIGALSTLLMGLSKSMLSMTARLSSMVLLKALPRLAMLVLRIPSLMAVIAGLTAMGILKRYFPDVEPSPTSVSPSVAPPILEIPERLGAITKKYESGSRGVETISSGAGDAGGVSYGEYQLSSKTGTMARFLRSPEGKPFASNFEGLEPGTPEFNKVYTNISKPDSPHRDEFTKAQHNFIVRSHYEPALKTAGSLGFAVGDRGIQEAVFSSSVQHGKVGSVLQSAAKIAASEKKDIRTMTPEEQIPYIYKARSEYVSGLSSVPEETKAAIVSRYASEQKDVLDFQKKQPGSTIVKPGAAGVPVPDIVKPGAAGVPVPDIVKPGAAGVPVPGIVEPGAEVVPVPDITAAPLPLPNLSNGLVTGEIFYIQPIIYRTPQIFNNIIAA